METTFQFVSDPELDESLGEGSDPSTVLVPGKALKTFEISSPDCRGQRFPSCSTSRISQPSACTC